MDDGVGDQLRDQQQNHVNDLRRQVRQHRPKEVACSRALVGAAGKVADCDADTASVMSVMARS